MLSKLGNKLGNEVNYVDWKGLSLQKECTCELPTGEAQEEPIICVVLVWDVETQQWQSL